MKPSRKFCFVATLMFAIGIAYIAQADAPTFVYETVVDDYDLASRHGMALDPDGNAYVIAGTIGNGNDILVIKVGAQGTVLWTHSIAGNEHDYATGIALNDDGEIYLVGITESSDFPIVDRQQEVQIAVFDLAGKRVAVLTEGVFPPGVHSVGWNGRDAAGGEMPSGNYFVRLSTVAGVQGRKMTLLR